jgi:hypothetical protein
MWIIEVTRECPWSGDIAVDGNIAGIGRKKAPEHL